MALLFALIFCCLLFLFSNNIAISSGSSIPALIVFGDSSVDPGNNNYVSTIARSNFLPYGRDFPGGKATGRFCNGRVTTDFISEALGIKQEIPAYLDPAYGIKDFATGVSFASAATGYDNVTSIVLNVIPLWKQVDYFREFAGKLTAFQGAEQAKRTLAEAVYVVSLGTNDFLENYYTLPVRQAQFTVEEYESFLAGIAGNMIKQIYEQGGRKMSITSLPPMGCFPLERSANIVSGSTCREDYNKVALDFNGKLQAVVEKLGGELVGSKLVVTDVYHVWMNAIQNPSFYGFENVKEGCCATGMFEMGYLCDRMNPFTCKDASKYMFWDSFHPTEKTCRLIAYYAMNTTLANFL